MDHYHLPQKLAFSPRETAYAAGMSRTLLFRLWAEGRGPKRTVITPRKVIVLRADLEAWLANWPARGAKEDR